MKLEITNTIPSQTLSERSNRFKRNFSDFLSTNPAPSRENSKSKNLVKARLAKKAKADFRIAYPKGFQFSQEQKRHILHIYYTLMFDSEFKEIFKIYKEKLNRRQPNLKNRLLNYAKLTSKLFGCSENTVRNVIGTNGQRPDGRYFGNIIYSTIPDTYLPKFVDILQKNMKEGRRVTAKTFQDVLTKDGLSVSLSTVVRRMKQWGLFWGSLLKRDSRRYTKETIQKTYLLSGYGEEI